MKSGTEIDFDFFEKLFISVLDDSSMEHLLKLFLIKDNMCENDKKMIEILIENEKQMHFIKLKYLLMLQFIKNFGYFIDKINDNTILKVSTAGLTIYFRDKISKKYRYYEKKIIINLEKTCLKKFNKHTKNVMLKNIETNDDRNLFIKNIYLDSYNNILTVYEIYNKLLQYLFDFISQLMIISLRPFFFEKRHGVVRTIASTIYVTVYNIFLIHFFTTPEYKKKNGKTKEYKLKEDMMSLFQNINIIIEKNTLKTELLNILNYVLKISKNNNNDFLEKYKHTVSSDNHIKKMRKYKIFETITSIILNDAYFLLLMDGLENTCLDIACYYEKIIINLQGTHDFIDVLNEKPYQVAKTIPWNNNENNENSNTDTEYIFVLQNVTLEYEGKDGTNNKVLENINLNIELGKSHFFYGNSGCGKTTLLNALMKRVKITNGEIKFLDIYNEYTYFSIRKYLTYITSESALFSKDLYYNITYGLDEKILKEKQKEKEVTKTIIKYMTLFGLDKFIPTMKTKNATKLSKGQTQRVAIIRLFIDIVFNDTRILFLDEFTSNIDNKMEKIIYTELITLQKNPKYNFTIFYVSHNLYNMMYSDYNYEIDTERHSIEQNITNINQVQPS